MLSSIFRSKSLKSDRYAITKTGNIISKSANCINPGAIHISGNTIIASDSMLRGDLSNIIIGNFVFISTGALCKPPLKIFIKDGLVSLIYGDKIITDYVYIGKRVVCLAEYIGEASYILDDVIIGDRCILNDTCTIMPNTYIPDDYIVPENAVVLGNPGKIIGYSSPITKQLRIMNANNYYNTIGKSNYR